MFGFLAPQKRIPQYRRSYARVCQYQRRLFGITSLPFLSFEAAFLYQVAADLKLIPTLPAEAPECCRLRRLRQTEADETVGSFAAAFGVMLAGIKLQDDVADSGRWFNCLAWWKYGRQVQNVNSMLATFDPSLPQKITDVLAEHAALEKSGHPPIQEYAAATGRGFGLVFSSLAKCVQGTADLPQNGEGTADRLAKIGECLGIAIIAWDCAVDFDKDKIQGDFNPLRSEADIRRSLDYSLLQLAKIGWLLPEGSTSGILIASVQDRTRAYISSPPKQHPVRRWERWGLIREQGYAYARCDGCCACCAVGDCCECASGAGEATSCCAGAGNPGCCCSGCCCSGCCDGLFCCGSSNEKKTTKTAKGCPSKNEEPKPYAEYNERHGTTSGDLNPAGFVEFEGKKIPAKTATAKRLPAGTKVRVIRTDAYGGTVVDVTPPKNQ